ncbi:MAG: SpoIIIAH-like family protein, partial [Acutalibacteraceae bacterium]
TSLLTQFKNELQAETDTENLIKAKTAGECLVIINDSSAQVILPKGTLNDSVLIQITEIFEKNTDISAENLTIIETK